MKEILIFAAENFGYLGTLMFVLSYISKTRGKIIAFSFAARIVFIINYLVLGQYAGAVQNLAGGFAAAVSSVREKRETKGNLLPALIIVFSVAGGALTFFMKADVGGTEQLMTLFPLAGITLQNLGLWFKNKAVIRILTLSAIPLWLTYNVYTLMYPAICSDILSAAAVTYALVRYDILPYYREKHTKK